MDQIRAKYSYIGHFRGTRYGQIELSHLPHRAKPNELVLSGNLVFCSNCEEGNIGACDRMTFYRIGDNIYTSAQTHGTLCGGPNPPCTASCSIFLNKKEVATTT